MQIKCGSEIEKQLRNLHLKGRGCELYKTGYTVIMTRMAEQQYCKNTSNPKKEWTDMARCDHVSATNSV